MADPKTSRVPSSNRDAPTKSVTKDRIENGDRANTGGDWYDRFRGNYSKKPKEPDNSPFMVDLD